MFTFCGLSLSPAPGLGQSEKKVIKVRMTVIMEPESVFPGSLLTQENKGKNFAKTLPTPRAELLTIKY